MRINTIAKNRAELMMMNHTEGLRMSSTSSPSRRTWLVSSVASDPAAGASGAATAAPSTLPWTVIDSRSCISCPFDHVLLERDDVRQIAIVVVVVEPITDDEFVGNF